jgi:hypothetical protein
VTRRRSSGQRLLAAAIAALVLTGFGRRVPPVLALMGDIETVAATFSTETLDPPTNLSVSGVLLVKTLTWTVTVDTRATGYLVLRSTVSGGPYSQIATVTPRTTTTYVDVVVSLGTYYYVLKSYYGSWTSVNSNQDS